ncbi:hypothetical protein STEG23_014411 [Scotinomys teguina]
MVVFVTRIFKGLIIKNPEPDIGVKAERSEKQNSQPLAFLYEKSSASRDCTAESLRKTSVAVSRYIGSRNQEGRHIRLSVLQAAVLVLRQMRPSSSEE